MLRFVAVLSPRFAARVRPLVSTGSARAAPLASLRSSGQAAGLHLFTSGRATRLASQLGSGHWSPLVQLGPAGLRRVRLPHSSVFWSLALRSRALASAAHFLSDARSSARANPTGIRLLSSVPHLWSSSFDCPASPGKEKTMCDRIAPSHPLSWPCVSDLLTPTSKARADYAP